ncbi:hypothetical protein C7999DRAFT_11119 [Corynascus novoguineensis]|uniref:Uncharacterized protein n=1 Tax=Corynascus novoguineensis TaxID=1126955 RepID=A0AAN7D1A8_9PEZI|nr:hypothetical protein C7999DRAFT_11119 [Corynascus novoguineensis]
MSFGDRIQALLDTYANCISLLKAFGRSRQHDGAADSHQRRSRLRKSLKSDRSLVERTYSLKLSESGSRFQKGDTRAVKALDRVLKKLRSAIANLLRLSSDKDGLDLDYRSLMSLSNGSRTEAVKAIDSLSRRLADSSRSSLVTSSSTKAKAASRAFSSRHKPEQSSNAGSSTPKLSNQARQEQAARKHSSASIKKTDKRVKDPKRTTDRRHKSFQSPSLPPTRRSDAKYKAKVPQVDSQGLSPKTPGLTTPNRISTLSFSSGSTKLGEIPPRKWQSVKHHTAIDSNGDVYNVRPVFPLRPYTVEVKERKVFGWFGRRREA